MLIDNKTDIYHDGQIQTVWKYLLDHVKQGDLDIVSGFFSIAGLHALYTELNPEVKYRLIFSEMTRDDDFMNKVLNLLQGDSSIETALQLSDYAKNAVAFLRRATVEVHSVSNQFCHAKSYIFRDKASPSEDSFFVTGSSNLTEAGLGIKPTSNIELNHAERGNCNGGELRDIRDWFENQWKNVSRATIEVPGLDGKKQKKDVKQFFIEQIEQIFHVYTPEEIYYKILYELFNSDLNIDESIEYKRDISLLQTSEIWKTLFNYQQKGVISLIKMLRKHNGAILADSVGLGKTFSALAVIKYYQEQRYTTVLLCPKKLEQNWKQYLRRHGSRFDNDHFDYVVRFHTDLQNDRMENKSDARLSWLQRRKKLLIVIDESHNLRNEKSARYKELMESLVQNPLNIPSRDVKVLMLSATPINTGLNDVKGQFNLIGKGLDSAFSGEDFKIDSLDSIFRTCQKKYNEWCEKPNRTVGQIVAMLPPKFFSLTDKLIVARTRDLIENKLGEKLGFPNKLKPQNIDKGLDHFGDFKTVKDIYDAFENLFLAAYQPSLFIPESREKARKTAGVNWDSNVNRERFLVRMMCVLFMKRMESSWFSLMKTVKKVLEVHQNTLALALEFKEKLNNGEISIELPDEDEMEDTDDIFTLRKGTINLREMQNLGGFIRALQGDVNKLSAIYRNLEKFEKAYRNKQEADVKIDELVKILEEKKKSDNHKLVIFTAFADTAQFLFDELKERGYSRMACVTGQGVLTTGNQPTKDFNAVLRSFAPFSKLYNELKWDHMYVEAGLERDQYYNDEKDRWEVPFDLWKQLVTKHEENYAKLLNDPIDILIATDCLSEGQNLQDADLQVNYDIHWNPVRLIQRFGRIDRIGSPNDEVRCVNFWPEQSVESYLQLQNRVVNRMALMNVTGVETQELNAAYKKMIEDNPLIDKNAKRLLEELRNNSISDIESPQTLSLTDLSLEVFRQDFLDYLEQHQDFYRRMPNGAFSGFCALTDQSKRIPESLIAVLGYPHREPGDNKPYDELFLMCQPIDKTQGATFAELNRAEVLDFLRKNRKQPTYVPDWILQPDSEKVMRLSDVIKQWLENKAPKQAIVNIKDKLRSKTINKSNSSKKDQLLEEKFQSQNFDLIVWEYVTKE